MCSSFRRLQISEPNAEAVARALHLTALSSVMSTMAHHVPDREYSVGKVKII